VIDYRDSEVFNKPSNESTAYLGAVRRRWRQDADGQIVMVRRRRWCRLVDRGRVARRRFTRQRLDRNIHRQSAAGLLQRPGVGDGPPGPGGLGGEQTSTTNDEKDDSGDEKKQHRQAGDDDTDHCSGHDAAWRVCTRSSNKRTWRSFSQRLNPFRSEFQNGNSD